MKAKNSPPRFSESISNFCDMVTDVIRDYEWNKEEVERLNKLTQDYLHKLELEDLKYNGRAKVSTQITKCRRLRRASKDTVEVLEPFVAFIQSEKGKNMMNLIREALGKTRKVEERMVNRTYRFKVLDDNK